MRKREQCNMGPLSKTLFVYLSTYDVDVKMCGM